MTEGKNIVSAMIEQHRSLQKDLEKVADELNNEKPESVEIGKLLKHFTNDLTEHPHLENEVFYVDLLRKMKNKGQNTAKTEQFIAEMNEIGNTVMAFLGKYKDPASIETEIVSFKKDLLGIIPALNLRIESEESGVYAYWGLF